MGNILFLQNSNRDGKWQATLERNGGDEAKEQKYILYLLPLSLDLPGSARNTRHGATQRYDTSRKLEASRSMADPNPKVLAQQVLFWIPGKLEHVEAGRRHGKRSLRVVIEHGHLA